MKVKQIAEVGYLYQHGLGSKPDWLYKKMYWVKDSWKTGDIVKLKEKIYSPNGKLLKTIRQASDNILRKFKFPD